MASMKVIKLCSSSPLHCVFVVLLLVQCYQSQAEPLASGGLGNSGVGIGYASIHIPGGGSGSISGGMSSSGGLNSFGLSANEAKCPRVCACAGQTVDCSQRGLTQVPRRIPIDTERL